MVNRKITSVLRQQPKLTGQIGNTIIYVQPDLEDQQVDIVENGTYTIKANEGFDALNSVEVNADVKPTPPEKGIVINAFDEDGYPIEITIVGMESIPNSFMYSQNLAKTHLLARINKVNLSDDVKSFGTYCFYNHNGLTTINFPKDVTDTGYGTFYGCTKLSIKTLPDNIKTIGQSCFQLNHGLVQLSMPNVETISGSHYNQSAFGKSNSLKAVWIGSALTTTNQYNFYECTNLLRIFIDKPRNEVEKLSGYSSGFVGMSTKVGIVVCNDDPGFMTKEEFDAIDWSTYTE